MKSSHGGNFGTDAKTPLPRGGGRSRIAIRQYLHQQNFQRQLCMSGSTMSMLKKNGSRVALFLLPSLAVVQRGIEGIPTRRPTNQGSGAAWCGRSADRQLAMLPS